MKKRIFSDEKKFNLDEPDDSQFYWHDLRKTLEIAMSRNFGGGSVQWQNSSMLYFNEIKFRRLHQAPTRSLN